MRTGKWPPDRASGRSLVPWEELFCEGWMETISSHICSSWPPSQALCWALGIQWYPAGRLVTPFWCPTFQGHGGPLPVGEAV